jgi:DDB1- and CUL4-associated factor 11
VQANNRLIDSCIRFYDTSLVQQFRRVAEIDADDVNWSILDTALSPDRRSVAYSTWSDCGRIRCCNSHEPLTLIDCPIVYSIRMNENQEPTGITPLALNPDSINFCIFSLQFSSDGTEIIGGSNDMCLYVYDLQRGQRTLRVDG